MKSYELGVQLSYQVSGGLDHQESFEKNIELKFDAWEVESGKYGKEKVQGHFLLVIPIPDIKQTIESMNDRVILKI